MGFTYTEQDVKETAEAYLKTHNGEHMIAFYDVIANAKAAKTPVRIQYWGKVGEQLVSLYVDQLPEERDY